MTNQDIQSRLAELLLLFDWYRANPLFSLCAQAMVFGHVWHTSGKVGVACHLYCQRGWREKVQWHQQIKGIITQAWKFSTNTAILFYKKIKEKKKVCSSLLLQKKYWLGWKIHQFWEERCPHILHLKRVQIWAGDNIEEERMFQSLPVQGTKEWRCC